MKELLVKSHHVYSEYFHTYTLPRLLHATNWMSSH